MIDIRPLTPPLFPSGQEKIIDLFKKIIHDGRLGHAYLFLGERGIGKKTLFDYIAHMIMCENHNICMKCGGCRAAASGAHPDLIRISNGDKASIGVDKVREIIREIYVRPLMSDKKVIAVQNAHLMTSAAQNALLKVIEEPPEYAVFFLLCDSKSNILPTVISRVTAVNLMPLSMEALKRAVPDSGDFFYHYCGGNPGKLMELRDSHELNQLRATAVNVLMSMISDDEFDIYEQAGEFEKNREQTRTLTDLMVIFLRDALLLKSNLDNIIINRDKINEIKAFSASVSSSGCFHALECVQTAQRKLGKSGSLSMASQTMLIKCREVIHDRGSRNTL